jgi:SAM-dependent methyltransferase
MVYESPTRYSSLQRLLPGSLHRYLLHFEARIEEAVAAFARSLPEGDLVLDAGAGECRHAAVFDRQRYVAVDLAVGDAMWDYSRLDCVADLARLPFPNDRFDASLNVVTLEHVPEPRAVVEEIMRVLRPGGQLLVIVPAAWELHQPPNDYYRFTRYGMRYLLDAAGCSHIRIVPMGGFFRLLSRRLLSGLQFFPPWLFPLAALLAAPAALVLPLLDSLDREKIYTLGYVCTAQKQKAPSPAPVE